MPLLAMLGIPSPMMNLYVAANAKPHNLQLLRVVLVMGNRSTFRPALVAFVGTDYLASLHGSLQGILGRLTLRMFLPVL
jgi:hypothetical protein